jgi:hypothetical protein
VNQAKVYHQLGTAILDDVLSGNDVYVMNCELMI